MDPIDSDHTMSRDQILADSETASNGPHSPAPGVPFPCSPTISRPFYLSTYPPGSFLFTVVLVTPFRASFEGPCPSQFWFSTATVGRALPRMLLSFPMQEDSPPCNGLDIYRILQINETLLYSSHVPRLDEILTLDTFPSFLRLFHGYEIRGSK